MTRRAQLADGTVLEFPDGTPDAIMDKVVKQHAAPAAPQDDSAGRGFLAGAVKPVDNLVTAAMHIPGMAAIDRLGQKMGLNSASGAIANNDAVRKGNTRTGYQTLGNIAGTLPTAYLPGGAFTQGAASGALLSDKKDATGIATDAGIGAVTGRIGQGLMNGVANAASPVLAQGARVLHDAGIPQTLGQIAAGGRGALARGIAGAEEKMTSLPFIGDMIATARGRGVEAFNRNRANDVLRTAGLPDLPAHIPNGKEAVRHAGDAVSDAYNALIPQLHATMDAPFIQGLLQARNGTRTLPPETQRQFNAMINDAIGARRNGANLTGQALKDAETRLSGLARQYSGSANVNERRLGESLGDALGELRGLVARSNPQHAAELGRLNDAWSRLATVEKAAGRQGNADGIFTARQYAGEARNADNSVRRRATARGTARDQDLIDAASRSLSNRVPDSGTTGRAAMGALVTGAGGAALLNPMLAVPAAVAGLYTHGGQRALNSLVFGARPRIVQQGADALRNLANHAAAPIAALFHGGR